MQIAIEKPFFLKKLIIGPLIVPPIQVIKFVIIFLLSNLLDIILSFYNNEIVSVCQ